jgi:hypothetical protein
MDSNLNALKNNFSIIVNMRSEIQSTFNNLEVKIAKLKEIYSNLLKNNNQSSYTFGLDSLAFQRKLIDVELNHMKQFFLLLNNRIYCEYYKLYKIISVYIKKSFKDQKILDLVNDENKLLIYKDLEPYKEYGFEQIVNLHELILSILNGLCNNYSTKELKLQEYKMTNDCGLNLNNFIITFKFDNVVLKENIELYINYLEFFHTNQVKNLKRFITKIRILCSQIDHDVKFESKNLKKSMIENLKNDDIDNNIIDEIKDNLNDSNDENDVTDNISFDFHHIETNKIN